MIKRRTRNYVTKLLKENPEWRVLDLGGGKDPFSMAHVVLDIEDYSNFFKNKTFVQGDALNTPFEDQEFDFVICTHVIEHVVNPSLLCKELERIAPRGYVEFPTPLFDNLVVGNDNALPHGHIWWVRVDDDNERLSLKPKARILGPVLRPEETTPMMPYFYSEMQVGVVWENKIPFEIEDPTFTWDSGNSTGVVSQDLTNRVILTTSKCGRFVDYPLIKGKK